MLHAWQQSKSRTIQSCRTIDSIEPVHFRTLMTSTCCQHSRNSAGTWQCVPAKTNPNSILLTSKATSSLSYQLGKAIQLPPPHTCRALEGHNICHNGWLLRPKITSAAIRSNCTTIPRVGQYVRYFFCSVTTHLSPSLALISF
jgi:hypothetical protein